MVFLFVLFGISTTQRRSTGTNTPEQYEFIIELYSYAEHKSTIPANSYCTTDCSAAQVWNISIRPNPAKNNRAIGTKTKTHHIATPCPSKSFLMS